MSELKTKVNDASVDKFIGSIENSDKRKDAKKIIDMMSEVTKETPRMWGSSIVGFGKYHYKYPSGREGDWMKVGFSPRKLNLTLYLGYVVKAEDDVLKLLGKYKLGKGCLYINKLSDVDESRLRLLVKQSYERMDQYDSVEK